MDQLIQATMPSDMNLLLWNQVPDVEILEKKDGEGHKNLELQFLKKAKLAQMICKPYIEVPMIMNKGVRNCKYNYYTIDWLG